MYIVHAVLFSTTVVVFSFNQAVQDLEESNPQSLGQLKQICMIHVHVHVHVYNHACIRLSV